MWFHKKKNISFLNSIYFELLVHLQLLVISDWIHLASISDKKEKKQQILYPLKI